MGYWFVLFWLYWRKPVRTEVLRPTKLIDDKDEKQVKQNTIQTKMKYLVMILVTLFLMNGKNFINHISS